MDIYLFADYFDEYVSTKCKKTQTGLKRNVQYKNYAI